MVVRNGLFERHITYMAKYPDQYNLKEETRMWLHVLRLSL